MNRFEISKEYFYKRLSKYSKQDILNAMFTYIANLVYNGKVYKAIKKENGNGNNSSK
jgi:hypothetical protein